MSVSSKARAFLFNERFKKMYFWKNFSGLISGVASGRMFTSDVIGCNRFSLTRLVRDASSIFDLDKERLVLISEENLVISLLQRFSTIGFSGIQRMDENAI